MRIGISSSGLRLDSSQPDVPGDRPSEAAVDVWEHANPGIGAGFELGASLGTVHGSSPGSTAGWKACRDQEFGFSLRHPPDWRVAGPAGRCIQFQRGARLLPEGVAEVDVFIRVLAARGDFPSDYLDSSVPPSAEGPDIGRGVAYSEREELVINGLPAVRARFRSAGPTPNWGVEYAVRKGANVLDAYISQPAPDVEAEFEQTVRTLVW